MPYSFRPRHELDAISEELTVAGGHLTWLVYYLADEGRPKPWAAIANLREARRLVDEAVRHVKEAEESL